MGGLIMNDLLLRRRMMFKKKKGGRVYVPCVAVNLMYINTKLPCTEKTRIILDVYGGVPSFSYGCRNGNYQGALCYNGRFDFNGIGTAYSVTSNEWHNISHGQTLLIDGELKKTYKSDAFNNQRNIYLLCANLNGTISSEYKDKFFKGFRIEEDGVVVKNYLPCYDYDLKKLGFHEIIGDYFEPCISLSSEGNEYIKAYDDITFEEIIF